MTGSLDGKNALVTGGYTALGFALAEGFAKAGANLGLIARTREPLVGACKTLGELGVRAVPLVADITDEESTVAAFAEARQTLGPIDVLVNNTGIPGAIMRVHDMALSEWNEVLSVNLTGAMLCSREAVRHMVPEGGGVIVNIGSSAGKRGVPESAAYSASKWGMIGLTQAMAQEVGRENIRVNCIALGSVEGPRTDWQLQRKAEVAGIPAQQLRKQRMGGNSFGRFVRQREFVDLCLFLASDLSSGMTGQAINLTGGATFH